MRHGEADHNVAVEAGQGPALRYTEDGTLDSPLTSRGRDQVQLVGKRLEGERFDLAVSSDLVRAVDTGLAITGQSSLFGQMPSDPHCLSHLCRCQVIVIVIVIVIAIVIVNVIVIVLVLMNILILILIFNTLEHKLTFIILLITMRSKKIFLAMRGCSKFETIQSNFSF